MVLKHILIALVVCGCNQSLFDNGGGPGGGGVPDTCPEPCLGDAAKEFDGTDAGSTGHWRYLDDHRDRTWAPMTASPDGFVGVEPMNAITSCAKKPDAAACSVIPGALLLSSAGATTGADPAIEFTVTDPKVVTIAFRAHVPAGTDQIIRVYRNSREDVLLTHPVAVGDTVEDEITIDALPGERILVALAPNAFGAQDVGLQLFISDSGQVFPSNCKLAAQFSSAAASGIVNACGMPFTNNDDATSTVIAPALAAGPFTEEGMAADIKPGTYYTGGDVLDKTNDVTIQLWVRLDAVDSVDAGFAFSDMDLNAGGGVTVDFFIDGPTGVPQLEVVTCTDPGNPLQFAASHVPTKADGSWHFVRIVHTAGTVTTCVDGKKAMSFALPAGKLQSTFKPHFGKNVVWTPQGAFFDGGVDDVRVFATALACE